MTKMIPNRSNIMFKSDFKVSSQQINDDEGLYPVLAGGRVHYLIILSHENRECTFDELILCRPFLFIPKLPAFPDTDWVTMRLFRGFDGRVDSAISFEPLAHIESAWHPQHIDVLSLKLIKHPKKRIREVEFEEKTAISKVAVLKWLIPQLEHETRMHEAIATLRNPEEISITPRFLGHLFEGSRNVGFLLEKIKGKCPTLTYLQKCEATLRKLHGMGFIHGDANRHNFIIEQSTGDVKMVDLEHAEAYDEKRAAAEIKELKSELMDESGRGAPVTFMY